MDARTHGGAIAEGGSEDRAQRWLLLLLLLVGYVIYNLDKSILSILIEPLKAEFGLSDSQIGSLTGIVTTLPAALACLPVGMLADRFNRKRLLIILVTAWSGMTALCGFARIAPHLFAARAGVGAFEVGYTPVCMSVLSDAFPPRQRATAMGVFSLGSPFGVFMGLAIGGLVASAYGWRAAFWIAGIPGLVLAALLAFAMREPERGRFDAEARTASASLLAVLGAMLRDRRILYVAIGMTCGAVVLAALSIWTPSFLIRRHGFAVHVAGLAAAVVVGLCGAVGAAAGGAISDRLGRAAESRRLLLPIVGPLLSAAFGAVGLIAVESGIAALALLGAMAFFGQFYIGAGYGTMASLTAPRMRGAAMAVILLLFNFVSVSIGAMLVGTVSDLLQPTQGTHAIGLAIAASGVFSLLAAFCFWRAMRLIARDGLAPRAA